MDNAIDRNTQNITKAIVLLANRLNPLKIDWFLGSSGALMIQGVNIVPNDLDILIHPKDLDLTVQALQQFVINSDHDHFEYEIFGINVEVIKYGHFESVSPVVFCGVSVPVDSLENKLAYYQQVPGKEHVVKLIKDKLKDR